MTDGGLVHACTLQKNPVNIKANYAKRVDKWNIRRIREYPADFRLQIYPEIRLSKNGNNIWKYKLRFKDLKELDKLFHILETQLPIRYIITIYGKPKSGESAVILSAAGYYEYPPNIRVFGEYSIYLPFSHTVIRLDMVCM